MGAHCILFELEEGKEKGEGGREGGRLETIETWVSMDFAKHTIYTMTEITIHT